MPGCGVKDLLANAIAAALTAGADGEQEAGGHAARQADEVREIGRRLVRNLTRAPFRSFAGAVQGAVLIAESLRPSDAALIDPARIAGVATEEGGTDGHTAILLRALGIPAILGASGLSESAERGDLAVLDGAAGTIVLRPGDKALEKGRAAVAAFAKERAKLAKLRRLPAVTTDGEPVELTAREFDLLAFLVANPNTVYTRADLLDHVWDSSPEWQDPATVTVHVRRLRQKLEQDPQNPRWLKTVWGVGYRWDAE